MCHLLLLMPIIGLVVFWIWPLSIAIPVYLVILILSTAIYVIALKSMRKPVVTGSEGLIGKAAEILDMSNHKGHVRIENEIWDAYTDEPLQKGDEARVIEIQGMTLKIARAYPIDNPKS
jgi:membrane protein implicated in regulation of membrane protease activity